MQIPAPVDQSLVNNTTTNPVVRTSDDEDVFNHSTKDSNSNFKRSSSPQQSPLLEPKQLDIAESNTKQSDLASLSQVQPLEPFFIHELFGELSDFIIVHLLQSLLYLEEIQPKHIISTIDHKSTVIRSKKWIQPNNTRNSSFDNDHNNFSRSHPDQFNSQTPQSPDVLELQNFIFSNITTLSPYDAIPHQLRGNICFRDIHQVIFDLITHPTKPFLHLNTLLFSFPPRHRGLSSNEFHNLFGGMEELVHLGLFGDFREYGGSTIPLLFSSDLVLSKSASASSSPLILHKKRVQDSSLLDSSSSLSTSSQMSTLPTPSLPSLQRLDISQADSLSSSDLNHLVYHLPLIAPALTELVINERLLWNDDCVRALRRLFSFMGNPALLHNTLIDSRFVIPSSVGVKETGMAETNMENMTRTTNSNSNINIHHTTQSISITSHENCQLSNVTQGKNDDILNNSGLNVQRLEPTQVSQSSSPPLQLHVNWSESSPSLLSPLLFEPKSAILLNSIQTMSCIIHHHDDFYVIKEWLNSGVMQNKTLIQRNVSTQRDQSTTITNPNNTQQFIYQNDGSTNTNDSHHPITIDTAINSDESNNNNSTTTTNNNNTNDNNNNENTNASSPPSSSSYHTLTFWTNTYYGQLPSLIANCPKFNNTTKLSLRACLLGDECVETLCNSPYLLSLQHLNLSQNPHITNNGLRMLMKSPISHKLKHLDIRQCSISADGIVECFSQYQGDLEHLLMAGKGMTLGHFQDLFDGYGHYLRDLSGEDNGHVDIDDMIDVIDGEDFHDLINALTQHKNQNIVVHPSPQPTKTQNLHTQSWKSFNLLSLSVLSLTLNEFIDFLKITKISQLVHLEIERFEFIQECERVIEYESDEGEDIDEGGLVPQVRMVEQNRIPLNLPWHAEHLLDPPLDPSDQQKQSLQEYQYENQYYTSLFSSPTLLNLEYLTIPASDNIDDLFLQRLANCQFLTNLKKLTFVQTPGGPQTAFSQHGIEFLHQSPYLHPEFTIWYE